MVTRQRPAVKGLSLLLLFVSMLEISGFSTALKVGRNADNVVQSLKNHRDESELDFDKFRAQRQKLENEEEFDGYSFRDLIFEKWGECYDVDFNRVDSFGFREIYLNIYPFKMGGRGKWRHKSELDYLMHLQAIVEILQKYGQLQNVIQKIKGTSKKPKLGAPIRAVPIRLELAQEEINKIIGY
jgi:Domain of unknown function (DUF3067)